MCIARLLDALRSMLETVQIMQAHVQGRVDARARRSLRRVRTVLDALRLMILLAATGAISDFSAFSKSSRILARAISLIPRTPNLVVKSRAFQPR